MKRRQSLKKAGCLPGALPLLAAVEPPRPLPGSGKPGLRITDAKTFLAFNSWRSWAL